LQLWLQWKLLLQNTRPDWQIVLQSILRKNVDIFSEQFTNLSKRQDLALRFRDCIHNLLQ
jgi:hypothetical protein